MSASGTSKHPEHPPYPAYPIESRRTCGLMYYLDLAAKLQEGFNLFPWGHVLEPDHRTGEMDIVGIQWIHPALVFT